VQHKSLSVVSVLPEPVAGAFPVVFSWKATQRRADFLQFNLSADSGPLSTCDYRIMLEVITLNNRATFIHLSFL